jgi:DGQHR domain-containing protein
VSQNRFTVSFQAIKVQQPIGEFFIASIPSSVVTSISYADVRRIECEQRDVEKYLGIQRPLKEKRVVEIREYVGTKDATFPTAIILAVKGVCAEWDEHKRILTLTEYVSDAPDLESIPSDKIAKILDGQHRVAGLEGYAGEEFDLNVCIFIDADIAEQATIFATVNLAQTKVNRSLVYDLFDLAKSRSPQKTCHNIAVALDAQPTSPFYERIKRLGVATHGRFNETLTQATIVESLLPYLSAKPNEDRDRLLRGRRLHKADELAVRKQIFRNIFIEERDADITKIIWAYFQAVAERWPIAWTTQERGNILPKTNGFRALMRFLRPVYLHLVSNPGELIAHTDVLRLLIQVSLNDADFNIDNFPPGTSGEAALYRRLVADSRLSL